MDLLQPAVDRLVAADAAAVNRPDAQAWTLLGLRAAGEDASAHASRLARFQLEDGSLPVRPDLPQAHWPTAIAALAWAGLGDDSRSRARLATRFLTHIEGQHQPKPDTVGHDTSIIGWSWIDKTHSWVEPSSLALLAIDRAGVDDDRAERAKKRAAWATDMIMDRQLPGGGWNYGNTVVLKNTLKPLPEETAMALAALRGRVEAAEVGRSLKYLDSERPHLRSPATLAWALLASKAWGRPVDSEPLVRACLGAQSVVGEYPVDMLAQLLVAVRRPELVLGETDAEGRHG